MLVIRNREKLKLQRLIYKDLEYYVEGVYEYPTQYQIHLRSIDKSKVDELLILQRHKTNEDNTYTIYNHNDNETKLNLTYDSIMSKGIFMCAIESMLNQ